MAREISRRGGLGLIGGALGGAVLPPAAAQEPPERAPLVELAARAGLGFGASIGVEALDDPAYGALYRRECGLLTTDTALKIDHLRPDAGPVRFAEADRLLAFAAESGMALRGHALAWNENVPGWIAALPKPDRARLLDEHVAAVAGRYRGRLHSWDVVNEPFWPDHGVPGGWRRGPWFDAMGPAYVERALRAARRADPSARLVINEAFAEREDDLGRAVRAGLLRLVDDLKAAGAPLDAVGLQGHVQPQFPFDAAAYGAFLAALAKRGVAILLTEVDVDDLALEDAPRGALPARPGDPPFARRDAAAAERVAAVLGVALACPAVESVQCWQLADRFSWYRDPALLRRRADARAPRPLPFDADLNPKPMRDALARAFRRRPA